jgi:acyl carrier protein
MVLGRRKAPERLNTQGDAVTVRDELYDYINENFLYLQPDLALTDEDRFLELGVIDSTGVVELVGEVEERYGICVEDDEITEENFGSLSGLVRFVASKRPATV